MLQFNLPHTPSYLFTRYCTLYSMQGDTSSWGNSISGEGVGGWVGGAGGWGSGLTPPLSSSWRKSNSLSALCNCGHCECDMQQQQQQCAIVTITTYHLRMYNIKQSGITQFVFEGVLWMQLSSGCADFKDFYKIDICSLWLLIPCQFQNYSCFAIHTFLQYFNNYNLMMVAKFLASWYHDRLWTKDCENTGFPPNAAPLHLSAHHLLWLKKCIQRHLRPIWAG